MIPHCRKEGCQVEKLGRPPCTQGCVLAKPEGAEAPRRRQKKPKVPEPEVPEAPEPEQRVKKRFAPRTHIGTGKVITLKTLPPWRSKPSTPEPWERAICGTIASGPMPTNPRKADCEVCLRLKANQKRKKK